MKNRHPPPISGLSLLSYPSSRLFRMCVTSLSYTLGVSTHVLLDTSSSSSVWKELQGGEREKNTMQSISYFKKRESSIFLCVLCFLYRGILGDARYSERKWFKGLNPHYVPVYNIRFSFTVKFWQQCHLVHIL